MGAKLLYGWDSVNGEWIPMLVDSTGKLKVSGAGGNVATDPIWDAKGDLAAGTGPDAAIRLAVGSD